MVPLDPLRHFGLTLTWRLEGERTRRGRGREAGLEHRLDTIRVLREVPFVPGHQILKQVREMHGGPLFEVTMGPLIGDAGQGLQIGDVAGAHIRVQGGGEAEESLRLSKNRLRTGDIGCQRQLARQALFPVETAPGETLADTRHLEQAARLVVSRPEEGFLGFLDIGERVAAEQHGHIILFQADRPEARRGLVTGERPGFLQRIYGVPIRLGRHQIDRQIRWVACSRPEEARRLAQGRDVVVEVGKSPGYRGGHSCGSGRESAFQIQEGGLEVMLHLLQRLGFRRHIQPCGNDMIVQGRHPDGNRAIAALHASAIDHDHLLALQDILLLHGRAVGDSGPIRWFCNAVDHLIDAGRCQSGTEGARCPLKKASPTQVPA